MSELIVAKFGGTSVENVDALGCVAEIVEKNKGIRVVVVSAVGGVTQLLINVASRRANVLEEDIEHIIGIHRDFLASMGDAVSQGELLKEFNETLEELRGFEGRSINTREELDEWLCFGERLSSILVTLYLNENGGKAELFDVGEVLKTDNEYGMANPMIERIGEESRKRLMPFLEGESVMVTQGFLGRTLGGRTTTLGRGGSDYSAALIAEALGAGEVHIYTDTDGVHTADPSDVGKTYNIPRLTFGEMGKLTVFGVKVLHPATLTPCERADISIFIGSTFKLGEGGTWVVRESGNLIEFNEKELVES